MQEELEVDNNNFIAIPNELKGLKQWFCYKILKKGKVPFDIKTGHESDFSTLFSFEECSYKVEAGLYSGLGFYLDDTQKYAVISLNGKGAEIPLINKFEEIIRTIGSYAENSLSGFDFKIWVKGSSENIINGKQIEILSKNCPVYFTGNSINNAPIIEAQSYLELLYQQALNPNTVLAFAELKAKQEKTDEEIIKEIKRSKDENAYISLKNNLWKSDYNSIEEAENAFIEIICKHTKNELQITRILSESKIFDDSKGYDYYEAKITKCLNSNKKEKYNIETVVSEIVIPKPKPIINKEESEEVAPLLQKYEIQFPPGVAGEIARYFYDQSARQVKEVSVIGSLALLAGICGKGYNISNCGLNLYLMLLANTGIGKDDVARGFDRIFKVVSKRLPQIKTFRGAGEIASGQSLTRDVAKYPCQVSILGEFYSVIKRISAEKVQPHDENLKKVLLDLYNKSGKDAVMQRMIYADEKRNVEPVKAPSYSIFGECNPQDLYESINEKLIFSGLLPRFIMVQYKGKRQYMNPNFKNFTVNEDFADKIRFIADRSLKLISAEEVIEVQTNENVKIFLEEIDKKTTDYINNTNSSPAKDLWNRVHLKVMKVSALLAVADDCLEPIINLDHAKWAYDLILNDTQSLINKFDVGEIGANNESQKQIQDLMSSIKFYLNSKNNILAKYKVNFDLHSRSIISYSFIYHRLYGYASFKNSRYPVPQLIKNAIKNLEDCGYIEPVYMKEIRDLGIKKGLYYKIINHNIFRE